VSNWELFLNWLVGTEAGERFMAAFPDIVDHWLWAFNAWAASCGYAFRGCRDA